MTNKITTIKDIAEKANVSIGTVDRVIHNRKGVSKQTCELIYSIMRENNYKPNVLARLLSSKKEISIAVVLPKSNKNNSYWDFSISGFKQALSEYDHFAINICYYLYEQYDSDDFYDKSLLLFEDKPDVVIMAPVLLNESRYLTYRLEQNNINYYFIDSLLPETKYLGYYGIDSFGSGRLAANMLNFGTSPGESILVLDIAQRSDNLNSIRQRSAGFKAYFDEIEHSKKLVFYSSQVHQLTQNLDTLFNGHSIKAIFVTNSKVHLVAKYLKESNLECIKLMGYDLIENNLEYLKSCHINYLLTQHPEKQGYQSIVNVVNSLFLNKEIESKLYLTADIVAKDNYLHYIKNVL